MRRNLEKTNEPTDVKPVWHDHTITKVGFGVAGGAAGAGLVYFLKRSDETAKGLTRSGRTMSRRRR